MLLWTKFMISSVIPNPELDQKPELFTVGHSNYALADFVRLVDEHKIEVIVDVRSNPYSKYAKHFHGPLLDKTLADYDIKYVYLGHLLGGKPKESEFYDSAGQVDYAGLARSSKFVEGMQCLQQIMKSSRVALMCGEEDPSCCHRHLLIGKEAVKNGLVVKHIRKNAEIENYESLSRKNAAPEQVVQLSLFKPAVKSDPYADLSDSQDLPDNED